MSWGEGRAASNVWNFEASQTAHTVSIKQTLQSPIDGELVARLLVENESLRAENIFLQSTNAVLQSTIERLTNEIDNLNCKIQELQTCIDEKLNILDSDVNKCKEIVGILKDGPVSCGFYLASPASPFDSDVFSSEEDSWVSSDVRANSI